MLKFTCLKGWRPTNLLEASAPAPARTALGFLDQSARDSLHAATSFKTAW